MDAFTNALDLLRQLAEAMGQTTAYLWPKVVLYEWGKALISTIMLPLVWLIAFTVFYKAVRDGTARKWPEEPSLYIRVIPTGLIMLFVGLVLLIEWPSSVATLMSPEGRVALHILGK